MPRILVIDDQPHVRAMISVALEAHGIDVVAVESGRSGLREIGRSNFDLAIVDIFMPEMDGVKLIKSLRERIPDLPVIAISGEFLRPTGRNVLNILPMAPALTGITCLAKPFRPRELLAAIQTTIGAAAPQ
jgi:CheY-like chemotaxis protein